MAWAMPLLAAQPTPRLLIKNSAYGRPNIVLIVVEELGYGDLGCYGQTKLKTPSLDQLAAEGMKFTQAYAGSPLVAPSHAALLTGKHTGHSSLRGSSGADLAANEPTLAEMLQANVYLSCALGKWALGADKSAPRRRGFEEWFGLFDAQAARKFYPQHLNRNDRKIEINPPSSPTARSAQSFITVAATNFFRSTQVFPFFLYRAYAGPPTNAPGPGAIPAVAQSWPAAEQARAAWLAQIDQDLGQMMASLKGLKLDDKTVVIFTSANGPAPGNGTNANFFPSAGPWRTGQPALYEGNLRVPLIVRWPNRVKAGATNDLPVAHWDIAPTAAELADVKAPAGLDGTSLVPALLSRPVTNRQDHLYWELHQDGFQQAARWQNWKAVRKSAGGKIELYDLKTDPAEKNDLADKAPEVIVKMTDILRRARTDSPAWPAR